MKLALGWQDLSSADAWRATLAETIALFAFVFVGAGAVVMTGTLPDGALTPARLVAIALAHGLAIAFLVAATARISGGHLNPAMTVAAVVTGKMGVAKGGMYVIGQLIGAVVGALLLNAVVVEPGNLGTHALGDAISGTGAAVAVEAVLTFFLVFVIFATAVDPKGPGHLAPIAIGLVVLVDHFVGVPLTGASMNPARSFGPALVAGEWGDHWVYWVGPLVGGVVAGLLYEYVFLRAGSAVGKGGTS